jgi:DNA-binding XRE family transcriptional regulator
MSRLSRFEHYPRGKYGLPHMGAVIAAHRQKLGWTQDYLAIVCDVDKQTVVYWESLMYLSDMDRRVFLCKVLKIFPPALLGLTWRSIIDEEHTHEYITAFEHTAELLFENTYGLYEELLAFGYEGVDNKGVSPEMAYRFLKHQEELEKIVAAAPTEEREQWVDLLGRFYQLLTCIAQQHQQFDDALTFANKAVDFALSVDDAELRGSALYRRARVHLVQGRHDQARQDITAALEYAKTVRNPVTGSIYLLAAEVNSFYAKDDERLRKQCITWQNKVINALYNGKIEEDGTFLCLNLAAVHHERAKTFVRFALFHSSDEELLALLQQPHIQPDSQYLKEAHNAMNLAWENLQSGFTGWEKNFLMTEARLHLINRDIEGSAKTAKEAFNLATVLYAQKVKGEVKGLYQMLSILERENPYVRNLGVALGMY